MIKGFAEINAYGTYYYKDAELTIRHREDGPAIEYTNGDKTWFFNGQLHREDGPAIMGRAGCGSWWLDDHLMSFDEWRQEVRKYYETEEDYLLMLLKL